MNKINPEIVDVIDRIVSTLQPDHHLLDKLAYLGAWWEKVPTEAQLGCFMFGTLERRTKLVAYGLAAYGKSIAEGGAFHAELPSVLKKVPRCSTDFVVDAAELKPAYESIKAGTLKDELAAVVTLAFAPNDTIICGFAGGMQGCLDLLVFAAAGLLHESALAEHFLLQDFLDIWEKWDSQESRDHEVVLSGKLLS